MLNMFDLSDKVAIVTGSTKGIGKAIAISLAEHGAKVVVSSRDKVRVQETVDLMKSKGHEVIGIPCNVGNKTQLSNLVEETIKNLGQVDIAVGNAAINPHYGSSMKIPDEIFSKVMKTNIQSNLWLAQLVSPGMKERTDGSIIYISSIGGLRGSDVIGTYGISKAADMQLTRNLAIELGPSNIRVNCIAPGLVKTDFARALWEDPHYAEPRIASTPLRRFGKPEDISGAAVYLASNAGGWITGQTIVIDGGVTITV
jgi:NAD(P)-dependent dehydrogenase (short-subunit alcohol dehydrogenase family)